MTRRRYQHPALVAILAATLAGGCAALPFVIPPLIGFAADLMTTAVTNYDKPYADDLQELLVSVRRQSDPVHDIMPYNTPHTYDRPSYSEQDDTARYDQEQGEMYDDSPDAYEPEYVQEPAPGEHDEDVDAPEEASPAAPVSLDVLLVRKAIRNQTTALLPIKDGDVLRDGRGNIHAGDKFRVMFRANCTCYIYVVAIDGSAWAQGIFPPPGDPFANPVQEGKTYVIPQSNHWLSLDQMKGVETLFFVASEEKRDDIETIMARISGRERHPLEQPRAVREAAVIPDGFGKARPGRTPFAVQGQPQQHTALMPTTYFAETAGDALRVTRWFRHE